MLILAVGISGSWARRSSSSRFFNRLTLIVAVGLAGYFARRRLRIAVALPEPSRPALGDTPADPSPTPA